MRTDPTTVNFDWGVWEYKSLELFRLVIKPGDVFFDIGSYIGMYSIVFLKQLGFNGRVVCYEPNPITLIY